MGTTFTISINYVDAADVVSGLRSASKWAAERAAEANSEKSECYWKRRSARLAELAEYVDRHSQPIREPTPEPSETKEEKTEGEGE